MIEKIIVKNTSSCFDSKGIELKDLRKSNYLYGPNGTGKTTISRVMKDCESYNDCRIVWKDNNRLETIVYNRDFVSENFYNNKEIKGIFTLGKDSYEIQEEIRNKKKYIGKIEENLMEFERKLEDSKKEKNKIDKIYQEKCWELKVKYDKDFKESFRGFRISKEKFKGKCIKEAKNNSALKSYDELMDLYNMVFSKERSRMDLVEKIDFNTLYEIISSNLLTSNIIGSQDVGITALIKKLNNTDWVKQGYEYYKKTNRLCPFCQRSTDDDLEIQLQNYFDEEYRLKTKKVRDIQKRYTELVDLLISHIEDIISNKNQYLNKELIKYYKDIIELKHGNNQREIIRKIKEPSIAIKLEALTEDLEKINSLIEEARIKTIEFNKRLDNVKNERIKLTNQVWKYIKNENEIDYIAYKKNLTDINKSIHELEEIIKVGKSNKEMVIIEKRRLESKITSTSHTVNEINKILTSFGFTSFKLAEVKDKGYYKIIRDDGENAISTLSQGEKSFISFLYFYHLLKGSNNKEEISNDRIVVIDDPIVSLDDNVLFIVSNLIREIVDDLENKNGNIKQLFILTHNIHFYKEVSFNRNWEYDSKGKIGSFFILRKEDKNTRVKIYKENPIKSSYELLWEELKSSSKLNFINMENIMKRIIKDYFKILGGLRYDDLIKSFKNEEQIICKKLLSWINSGVTSLDTCLYIDNESETIENYISVFKDIFVLSGNESHYKMMMGKSG